MHKAAVSIQNESSNCKTDLNWGSRAIEWRDLTHIKPMKCFTFWNLLQDSLLLGSTRGGTGLLPPALVPRGHPFLGMRMILYIMELSHCSYGGKMQCKDGSYWNHTEITLNTIYCWMYMGVFTGLQWCLWVQQVRGQTTCIHAIEKFAADICNS